MRHVSRSVAVLPIFFFLLTGKHCHDTTQMDTAYTVQNEDTVRSSPDVWHSQSIVSKALRELVAPLPIASGERRDDGLLCRGER